MPAEPLNLYSPLDKGVAQVTTFSPTISAGKAVDGSLFQRLLKKQVESSTSSVHD